MSEKWLVVVLVFIATCFGCSSDDDAFLEDGSTNQDQTSNETSAEPATLRGITAAHNSVREAVGVSALVWDQRLAAIAGQYASNCVLSHNPNRGDDYPDSVGENIFASSFDPSGSQVVDQWAAEEANYDYGNNSCSGVCGHYTQVVWSSTNRVGCAEQHCPGSRFAHLVVCNYAPAGNIAGRRPY